MIRKIITYHREDGTEVSEEDPDYEETGFDLIEEESSTGVVTFTATLTQFYGRGGEFTMRATYFPDFPRKKFIAVFVVAIGGI